MSVKQERLASIFAKEITNIINFDLKNPSVTMVSVTRVTVSKDLNFSKIYVSIIDQKAKHSAIEALNKSKGFIKSELAKRLSIRKIPDLLFIYDDTLDKAQRIEDIINRINKGE